MKRLVIRSLLTWVAFIPIAVLNGIIRERVYGPRLGDLAAQQISTVSGTIAFIALAYATLRDVACQLKARRALAVGAYWVLATMGFEFGLGRIRNLSWAELFGAYNILRGKLWGLFLVVMFFTPSLTRRLAEARR